MKSKKCYCAVLFVILLTLLTGCSLHDGYGKLLKNEDTHAINQKDESDERTVEVNNLPWHTLIVPQDGKKKLSIDVPFDFETHKKYELSEIKNADSYAHKGKTCVVTVSHGEFVHPEKKIDFSMDDFKTTVKGVKNRKLIKKTKNNVNGDEMTYLSCVGNTEKDDRLCQMEFVGIRHDNEFWLVSFVYLASDGDMDLITNRSIASIKIQ